MMCVTGSNAPHHGDEETHLIGQDSGEQLTQLQGQLQEGNQHAGHPVLASKILSRWVKGMLFCPCEGLFP